MSTVTSGVNGRVIDGRYRVERLLARGGMASVYRAFDLRLRRNVALKVMHPDLARDEAFVGRFRREAQSAARLQHPHVVSVYDQGEDGDVAFLAMELVEGQTLRDVIAQHGPHSARDAAAYLDPVLQALQAAHRAELVHRDVKPENVLIHRSGAIKVADFGLARAVTSSTVSHSSDLAWGTAAYLSPEQVERGRTDARSDVYAAGLLLYELLTGVKAFPGDNTIHVAYAHVHGQLPRAADLVPSVPAELDALIQWAGATDPEQRPVDAGVLLEELRRVIGQLSDAELDAVSGASSGGETDPNLTQQFAATTPLREAPAERGPSVEAGYARTTGNRKAKPPPGRPQQRPRGRRRIGGLLVALLLLVAAGGAGATWYYTAGPGIHSAMPAVVDLSESDARALLDARHLDPVTSPAYSETVPSGRVLSADREPGEELRHGTDVHLVISQGPERYAVPSLEGSTAEQASTLLEEHHLVLGEQTTSYSETVPEGQIISQTPPVGTSVKPDTPVAVEVSKGREPLDIPSLQGKPQGEAEEALTGLGLVPSVDPTQVFSTDVPEGSVVSHVPSSGTAHRGDTVTLVISKGPEMVTVPGVIGRQFVDAEPELTALGLNVTREDIAAGYFGTIRFQSIDPGEQVPKGTTILLTVL